LKEWNKN